MKGKDGKNSAFYYSPPCLLIMNFSGGYDVINWVAKNSIKEKLLFSSISPHNCLSKIHYLHPHISPPHYSYPCCCINSIYWYYLHPNLSPLPFSVYLILAVLDQSKARSDQKLQSTALIGHRVIHLRVIDIRIASA